MTFQELRELGVYNPAFIRRLEEREQRRKQAIASAMRSYEREQRRLDVESEIINVAMKAEKVREMLMRAFDMEGDRVPVKVIIHAVGILHRITPAEITGKGRTRPLVSARQDAYALVKYLRPDHSLTMIAREFNRDHTSVLHGLRVRGWDGARWIDGVPDFSKALCFLTETRQAA